MFAVNEQRAKRGWQYEFYVFFGFYITEKQRIIVQTIFWSIAGGAQLTQFTEQEDTSITTVDASKEPNDTIQACNEVHSLYDLVDLILFGLLGFDVKMPPGVCRGSGKQNHCSDVPDIINDAMITTMDVYICK